MAGCTKHQMLPAAGRCNDCNHEFCEECLVFPFGMTKPPLCVGCALAFAGVRSTRRGRAKVEKVSFSERRRRARAPKLPERISAGPGLLDDLPDDLPRLDLEPQESEWQVARRS